MGWAYYFHFFTIDSHVTRRLGSVDDKSTWTDSPLTPRLLPCCILHGDDSHRLLALVVGRLCQRMPAETRDTLLFPLLLRPLLLPPPNSPDPPDEFDDEFDEATVERALTDLHIVVTAAPLLPTVAAVLAVPPLVFPLLEAWAFARQSRARGLAAIEESLIGLLRGADERAHALLVDGYLDMLLGRRGRGRRRLAFVAGGTGGVARRVVGEDDEEEGGGSDGCGASSDLLAAALGEALGGVGGEDAVAAASGLEVRCAVFLFLVPPLR